MMIFLLWGHSLKATTLINAVNGQLDVRVPLTRLFSQPTIRQMAQYIRQAKPDRYQSIPLVEDRSYYPLSSAQKRLYILHRLDKKNIGVSYNVPVFLVLEGRLDSRRLEDTFSRLIGRHESFRTSFHTIDDEPVQVIHKKVEFKPEEYDLTAKDTKSTPLNEHHFIRSFVRPFDLSSAPLLRVGLLKRTPTVIF